MLRPEVKIDPRNRGVILNIEEVWADIGAAVITEVGLYTQKQVKDATPRDRGLARNSIALKVAEEMRGMKAVHTGIVFSELEHAQYLHVLEEGRRPGARMPPHEPMEIWTRRHFPGKTPEEILALTFLIRRAIARRGLPAHKMFETAFEKAGPMMNKVLKREVRKAIRRLS